MTDLVLKSLFDPLMPYITSITESGFLKALLPSELSWDKEIIGNYFKEDVVISYSRTDKWMINMAEFTGTLKDENLIEYLRKQMREKTHGYYECETQLVQCDITPTDQPHIFNMKINLPK